jgi:hypothetical protein
MKTSRVTWIILLVMVGFTLGFISADDTRPVFVEQVAMLQPPSVR